MVVIIHYSEIATKGKNRNTFEKILVKNIQKSLGKEVKDIRRHYGRIVFNAKNINIKDRLANIPGIASFSFGEKVDLDIKDIKKTASKLLKDKKFKTFRITTKRSNKKFKLDSQKVNEILGDYVRETFDKEVKLKNSDINIYLEICEKEGYMYLDKYRGVGGMPVGSGAKLVSCLSGGIDSPVASFQMMKRGCKVILVHFENPSITRGGIDKILSLAKDLAKFQPNTKIYIVPFKEIQKQIISHVPAKLRMITYRRNMLRIANLIALKEKAKGIITGDSLGQVASQTVENLTCAYDTSGLPVLPPLIGMNKEEIIEIAKRIDTYNHSIIPYPDCCSFMIADHPETKAKLQTILKIEKGMDLSGAIEKAITEAKIKVF